MNASSSPLRPPLVILTAAEAFGGAEQYITGLVRHLHGTRQIVIVSGTAVGTELQARLGPDLAEFVTNEDIVYDWTKSPEINFDRQQGVMVGLGGLLDRGAQCFINLNWLNVAPGILHGLKAPATVLLHLCPHKIPLSGFERDIFLESVKNLPWVCVAKENRFFLAQTLRVPVDSIHVIQNGPPFPIDVPFGTLEAREDARRRARDRLGLPSGAEIVLTVARHNSQKGFLEACLAIRDVVMDHPNLLWIWLGEGDDIKVHRHFLESAGLDGNTLFTATRDVVDWYAAADVFYQPSKYEGFSLSLLEGASAALPVVTTEVSGSRELIDDDRLGHVADPLRALDQVAMLADYLRMSARDRFEVASRLALRARAFTLERMYARMTALLDESF